MASENPAMPSEFAPLARPPITLLESEAEALADLALASLAKSSLSAKLLLQEIDRATTIPADELPPDVVTMLSHVVFIDESTGEKHSVQLVYPREADMAVGRVSVLTPIGAGLIGMRCGDAIEWPRRQGEDRRLQIVEVVQPPLQERAA
jgi:regulator of nucleoside diphosphate kinase